MHKKLHLADLRSSKAGIRAQLIDKHGRMVKDFLAVYGRNSTHILNAVSPGLTCSIAFAEHVVDNMRKVGQLP